MKCVNTARPLTHSLDSDEEGLVVQPTQAWRSAIYAPINAGGRRRKPNRQLQREILERQRNNCAYCSLPFNVNVERRSRLVRLRLEWDHFRSFSYLQDNPRDNWRAACQVCNGIKNAAYFDSDEDAAQVIRRRREQLGYEPVPVVWRRLLREPANTYEPPEGVK